jgi:hypothetical protein
MGGDGWVTDGALVETNADPGPYGVEKIEYTILMAQPPGVRGARYLWDRTGAQWFVLWIITDSGTKQPFAWPANAQAQEIADAIGGVADCTATAAAR